MVGHVALKVHLGGVLHSHKVGMEYPKVRGAPLWKTKPCFQMFPRQGVQGVAVSLVDVVDCEVELEGWKDVPGVHSHLVLASD